MPEARLRRTRDAYVLRCNHPSQIVHDFVVTTLPDGTTVRERLPIRFRVRRQGRYCLGCGQVVDDQDDAAAQERASHASQE